MVDVVDKKSGRINVSTYSAIQTVKYSLNVKTSHAFRPKSVQVCQRSDQLKSPTMSEVAEGMRNSKKVYENELAVSETISTDLFAERVNQKTSFENSLSSGNCAKGKIEGN